LAKQPNVSLERDADVQVLNYYPADYYFFTGRWSPPFLPQAIPQDIADDLIGCHGNPPAWFMGQFLFYLTRSSTSFQTRLSAAESKISFKEGTGSVSKSRLTRLKARGAVNSRFIRIMIPLCRGAPEVRVPRLKGRRRRPDFSKWGSLLTYQPKGTVAP
jgi:hypothetical protein